MNKIYKTKEGRLVEAGDKIEVRASERILKYLASLGLLKEVPEEELKKQNDYPNYFIDLWYFGPGIRF